jgi:D-sedoheptulose 7-phosphate isomerase
MVSEMKQDIVRIIDQHIEIAQALDAQTNEIEQLCRLLIEAFAAGHKLLICGNGGSAADAQHVAAEFVSRFLLKRKALPAIALTTDTSILTATSNDDAFERVFARQVEALAKPGDVLAGISTSGNSQSVLSAITVAKAVGCVTVGFTGQDGGKLKDCVDLVLRTPSQHTPRIQECHILIWHIVCEIVENSFYTQREQY